MENKKEIKFSKSVLYAIVITAIVVLAVSSFIFYFYHKIQHESQLNMYKKEMYNSILCQYSCPLTEQVIKNKTQLAPETSCVQTCTESFKVLQQKSTGLTNNDVMNDNLILDMQNIVKACQDSSIYEAGNLPQVNNTLFFSCVSVDMSTLKEKYPYLK